MAKPKPATLHFSSDFSTPPHEFRGAFRPVYCADHHFSGPWPCECVPGPQFQALLTDADEISLGGARGGAKSEVLLAFMVKGNLGLKKFKAGQAIVGPDVSYIVHKNYRGLILREQASDLNDILDRAEEMYKPLGAEVTRGSGGSPPAASFPSGAKIFFGHFGEDAWKKWLGQQYQRMGVDQMEMMPTREIHDRIIGSCRSKWPELKPQVISTWNPGGGSDLRGAPGQAWIMEYFRVEAYLDGRVPKYAKVRHEMGKTTVFIPAKVTDNPFLRYRTERMPDGSVRAVKAWKCKTCSKDTIAVERPAECANHECPTNKLLAA